MPADIGQLRYGRKSAVVDISPEIGEYYFNLIPKWKNPNRQKYRPHITVVRNYERELVKYPQYWNKWSGMAVFFRYSGEIKFAYPYFFLEVWSKKVGDIREELGLPRVRYGFNDYHITIGNVKEKL